MGYKQMNQNITFAELSLFTSMEHNRSLKRLEKINRAVDWSEVEAVISAHYTVGTRLEGVDAYPPLLLMKALLLQKWYQIDSDPELENQINDRISFKKFLGLSFDVPSPDHSTFSRFRGRLSQEAMREVNSVLLRQFSRKGLVINEGIAVDARSTRLTAREKERNKAIAKLRYIVEQYFGLSHLHMDAFKARFIRIIRNSIDALFRQMAFNIFRGGKILGTT
jgi:transposase